MTSDVVLPHEPLNGMPSPEQLVGHLGTAFRIFAELAEIGDRHARTVTPPPETSTVMAISGQRGAGKSTFLRFLCRELAKQPSVLLTPMLTPETFGPSDTLLSAFLVQLEMLLKERYPDVLVRSVDLSGNQVTMHHWLRSLQEEETFLRPSSAIASTLENTSPIDRANDHVYMSRTSGQFAASLKAFFTTLMQSSGERAWSRLVVPIDDPDLNMRLLPQMLLEIRSLASHDAIIPIVALNFDDATAGLVASLLTAQPGLPDYSRLIEYGVEPKERFVRAADQQIAKTLPPPYRIAIQPFGLGGRLTFAPLGERTSLGTLWHRLVAGATRSKPTAANDLLQFRDPGGVHQPTFLANALPGLPRELEAVYRLAKRANLSDPVECSNVLRQVLELVQASIVAQLPQVFRDTPPISFVELPHALGVDFDASHLRFAFSTFGPQWSFSTEAEGVATSAELSIKRIGDVYSEIVLVGDGSPYQRAPDALTSLMLLTHELSVSQRAFELRRGQLRTLGGSSMFGGAVEVSMRIDGAEVTTDGKFLYVPQWGTQLDGMRHTYAWNADLDVIDRVGASPGSEPVFVQWFALVHLHRVISSFNEKPGRGTRWSRMDEAIINDLLTGTRRGHDAVASSLDAFRRTATSAYKRATTRRNWRDLALLRWMEAEAFHTLHPDIIGADLVMQIATHLKRLVTRYGRAEDASASLVESFQTRFTGRGGVLNMPSWSRPYLDTIAVVDEAAADELTRLLAQPDPVATGIGQALGVEVDSPRRVPPIETAGPTGPGSAGVSYNTPPPDVQRTVDASGDLVVPARPSHLVGPSGLAGSPDHLEPTAALGLVLEELAFATLNGLQPTGRRVSGAADQAPLGPGRG